jgi:hypothetical protein
VLCPLLDNGGAVVGFLDITIFETWGGVMNMLGLSIWLGFTNSDWLNSETDEITGLSGNVPLSGFDTNWDDLGTGI